MIEGVLHQVGLNSHLVQGLAAFNPQILFSRPIDVALRHFEVLYNTFLLRSCVTSADESSYREEYLGLIDHLRITYPADFNFTDLSADLIEFLMGVDFLRAKPRLLRLFKLCCLCITACSREFPPVIFGNIGLVGNLLEGSLMSCCQDKVTCLGFPIQSHSAVRIQVCQNSPCLPLISEGQHSPPLMILGIMWTRLGDPKSISPYFHPTR